MAEDLTQHEPSPQHRDMEAFRAAINSPSERFSLFQSALMIAAIEYPTMDDGWTHRWNRELHQLTSDARDFLSNPPPLTPRVAIKRLATFLHEIQGFRGDTEDYSAPRNSCMNDVLNRRRGLPITLSILFVAIGQKLGFDCFGVGAPGHFLVGARPGNQETVYIDLFNGADLIDADEASRRAAEIVGQPAEEIRPYLVPMAPRKVLFRMLNNLKASYHQRGITDKLIAVTNWMLILDPENLEERRNRGLLLLRTGNVIQGAEDLLHYVRESPSDGPDIAIIRDEALRAIGNRAELN